MARGWESKSVEGQQEEASQKSAEKRPRLSPQEASLQREKQGLLLSRQRVLEQIHGAHNPQHRKMLEQALADLNQKLSKFT